MKNMIMFLIILLAAQIKAGEIAVSGKQSSTIEYQLEQIIEPFQGIDILMISFVLPQDFSSPTYSQKITGLRFDFSDTPLREENEIDLRGNHVRKFYWDRPRQPIQCSISLQAENSVQLSELQSGAPFPAIEMTGQVQPFLESTEQVQANEPSIQKKASEITAGKTSQFAAVQAVLHYVVDHLRYVLVPEQFDALYTLNSGRGNCQNFSHLSAALLRAAGIPVRIVNGITLKRAYDIPLKDVEYSLEMAQGRHSWIEVYFPDLGWLPFDPQQTAYFISSRYLRIEVGLDNEESVQDGLVRWTQSSGSPELMPRLEEAIESRFVADDYKFSGRKLAEGPRMLLLSPPLKASGEPVISEAIPPKEEEPELPEKSETGPETAPEPPPEIKEEIDYRKLKYDVPSEFGNLEFPQNVDFLYTSLMGSGGSKQGGEIRRNFLVETAEYVTGDRYFAQVIPLDHPVILQKVALAMHNFGGTGKIWLELSEDNEGKPGQTAARSTEVNTRLVPRRRGYDWVDFDFSKEGLLLTPGRYWIVLKYSGAPIVNAFYTYGKPVGPVDGTRSSAAAAGWNTILNYEFNYRVTGKKPDSY
ncbi:MAG: transglutaminase domain-containing protein [Calditrichia bacterium]